MGRERHKLYTYIYHIHFYLHLPRVPGVIWWSITTRWYCTYNSHSSIARFRPQTENSCRTDPSPLHALYSQDPFLGIPFLSASGSSLLTLSVSLVLVWDR